MSPVLRPARPEDAEALGAILQGWLDQTEWMPDVHDLAETQGFVKRVIAAQTVVVAGDCAGFLALEGRSLDHLYVAAPARGQGIGSALVRWAQSQQPGLRLWTFQANHQARAFYRRHGFVEGVETDGDNAEGLPDVQLTWRQGERNLS